MANKKCIEKVLSQIKDSAGRKLYDGIIYTP